MKLFLVANIDVVDAELKARAEMVLLPDNVDASVWLNEHSSHTHVALALLDIPNTLGQRQMLAGFCEKVFIQEGK